MANHKTEPACYSKLMQKNAETLILQTAKSVLSWDMETKMPPKGITLRSRQMELLGKVQHKIDTDPEIGALLEELHKNEYEGLDPVQKRNVDLIKKNYDEQTRLPEELVSKIARQEAIGVDAWKKAKAAKDFTMFKPELEKMVELKSKAAEILQEVKGTATPYDALIDIFEPGMNADTIARLFEKLRNGLISLLRKCTDSPNQPDASFLKRRVPIDVQRKISLSLARFMEYDVESKQAGGRIDETEHPFTTGYYDDVRITTHYHEDDFADSIFSTMHEGGHALYEQNLRREWIYQPVGSGCSGGVHESQSRFVENMIGRSDEFWTHYLPELKELSGTLLSDVDLDAFVQAVNRVEPSKIRIAADEVTYSLHVIIRFDLERNLFAGKISMAELPETWNQKYKEYLGVDIENDSEGLMQDIHWAWGMFGYFPSYALGNIYGGQILLSMEKELPDWKDRLTRGNFHDIKQWLVKNVHECGNLYDPQDLIRKVSGDQIRVEPYLDYLKAKFSRLYGF